MGGCAPAGSWVPVCWPLLSCALDRTSSCPGGVCLTPPPFLPLLLADVVREERKETHCQGVRSYFLSHHPKKQVGLRPSHCTSLSLARGSDERPYPVGVGSI